MSKLPKGKFAENKDTFDESSTAIAEKDILFSLNHDLTSTRNKEDILQTIHPKLKKLFGTGNIFICFHDGERNTLEPILRVGDENRMRHPDYERVVNSSFRIHDAFTGKVMMSREPLVFDIDLLNDLPDPTESMKLYKAIGLAEALSIALSDSGKVVGVMTILSEFKNYFTPNNKRLITEVAEHISIMVSNILAQKTIKKRERQNEILLSLSNEIATVRHRNDLLEVLADKLKELLPITGFGITLRNKDETHSPFVIDGENMATEDINFQSVVAQKYSVKDGVFDKILVAGKPLVMQVADLAASHEAPAYVRFWQKQGIIQVLGVSLRVSDDNLGCLIFHLAHDYVTIDTSLLQGVCSQISVAISNIRANDEIAKREEEKSILLSLSGEIASLKSRNDLFQIVNARIKKLFAITQFGIVQVNDDKATHSAFMMDLGDLVANQFDFKEVTSMKHSINDTAFSRVAASEDPVTLDVDELANEANPAQYVEFWKMVGFKKLLSLALRVGGDPVGAIFFNIKPNEIDNLKTNLLKGVCAQLAVAVSNILANEKLLDQLDEIKKYKQQLEEEKTYLKEEIETFQNYSEIIGESREIKKVFRMIEQVAPSDTTVLLQGETGTGKELVARAIHNSSPRRNKLMIKVNCAALPANLIESELFGHEKGSFTGAFERKVGKFELAHNGTLFLDEIGEMPLDMQVKLLRALQEKEIERIGGKTTIKTDVRIIAATNRDLENLMEEGKFRSDLYYRINIFPIALPPLRNRRDDIPHLVSYFIMRYAKKAGKKIETISNKVLQEMVEYDWPGNIRELEHFIERSVLLSSGDSIKDIHPPQHKRKVSADSGVEAISTKTIDDNEKEHILKVLKHTKGRIGGVGGAAQILGVPTSTLNSKMKRLGIRKEHLG